MSRIGKLPIQIPAGVTFNVDKDNVVTVKGKLGELSRKVNSDIKVELVENHIQVSRPSNENMHRSLHGLYRALISNMVVGVSTGFKLEQEVVGVGYKAVNNGQILELSLGYSHDIFFRLPDEVKVETRTERRANPIITLTSYDKELLGKVAAKIRSFRPPEPYKGKGIKFVNEVLRRKAGKAASV
ncbi:MAG: 50S ribosomal protein L6 [Bacteroidetes bacterium GWA2_30_7]|nr:MAG: 50S ribosomal protein L6 [Bacteroidetes bacterium GWA2_30_7]